jgi:hypothetical protein
VAVSHVNVKLAPLSHKIFMLWLLLSSRINSIAARFHLSISANRQGQENKFVRQRAFLRTPSEAKAAEPIQLMVESSSGSLSFPLRWLPGPSLAGASCLFAEAALENRHSVLAGAIQVILRRQFELTVG